MFTQSLRFPLRDKATDAPDGGSGNSPAAPATTPETAEPVEPAEPSANAPSMFDRAKSLMKSKPGLQADLTAATKQITQLEADLTTAQATIKTLTAENAAHKKNEADLTAHVEQIEAEQTTLAGAAAEQVAALGVPEESLPAQDTGDVESLESRYAASKKVGGVVHSQFMEENKAEIAAFLK